MTKIASVLGIDISQVKIASIVKGSTIVNFDILEKPPAQTINEDLSNNTNIFFNNSSILDTNKTNFNINSTFTRSLVELANSLNTIIGNGDLGIGYQILNSSILINTAKNNNTISPPSNNTNNSISNNTDPVNDNPNKDPSNNNTNPSNNTPSNNNNTNNNSTKPDDNKKNNLLDNFWYYVYCLLILIVIVVLVVFIVCQLKIKKDTTNLINNESNFGINDTTDRSFNIELQNKNK